MPLDPKGLLREARIILSRQEALAAQAAWARTVALLARQALEDGLEEFWASRHRGMSDARLRTQLLCLPWYVEDRGAARALYETWAQLSAACHHRAYDLAPTVIEIEALLENADSGLRTLREAG